MALDWGILHWIQNNITCPFLDAVVPKLTMLGNAGIIWILAGVLLLCTKKYRRQGALVLMGLLVGLLVGNVALKHLVARSRPCWLDPSVQLLIATPTDYSFPSGHTLSSTIASTILTKTDRHFSRGAHRPVAAVPVRPLPERRVCRSAAGSSDRRADVPLWRKAARQNFPQANAIKKPRTPFQNGVRGLYILGIYTFFAARNKFGGAGKRFSRSSTANPASVTDRSSERIVSNAT